MELKKINMEKKENIRKLIEEFGEENELKIRLLYLKNMRHFLNLDETNRLSDEQVREHLSSIVYNSTRGYYKNRC